MTFWLNSFRGDNSPAIVERQQAVLPRCWVRSPWHEANEAKAAGEPIVSLDCWPRADKLALFEQQPLIGADCLADFGRIER